MNNAKSSHIFLYVEVSPVKEGLSNSDRCQWFDQGGDEAAIAQFSLPATFQPPPWPRSALPLSGDEDRDRIGGTLRPRTFQLLVIVEVTNTGEILVRGKVHSLRYR